MGPGTVFAILFLAIAAAIIAPSYFRNRERMALQETLRAAYQNGQPVPPEVIDALTTQSKAVAPPRPPSPVRDIRLGVILLSVGAGFGAFGYMISMIDDAEEAFYPMVGLGIIPAMIGLAFLALGLVGLLFHKKS